jgi:hypothetical protein
MADVAAPFLVSLFPIMSCSYFCIFVIFRCFHAFSLVIFLVLHSTISCSLLQFVLYRFLYYNIPVSNISSLQMQTYMVSMFDELWLVTRTVRLKYTKSTLRSGPETMLQGSLAVIRATSARYVVLR